jgi:hypothetical protein
MLNIYEIDHGSIPAQMSNYFEVYEEITINPIFTSDSLDKAKDFCYSTGKDFTVHTLEEYYSKEV